MIYIPKFKELDVDTVTLKGYPPMVAIAAGNGQIRVITKDTLEILYTPRPDNDGKPPPAD